LVVGIGSFRWVEHGKFDYFYGKDWLVEVGNLLHCLFGFAVGSTLLSTDEPFSSGLSNLL